MGKALVLRVDYDARTLRRLAKASRNADQTRRLLALAAIYEGSSRGEAADYPSILEDVKRRDERDMGRADSPLKPAEDAHLLDTSEMSIEAAFLAAKTLIDAALTK